MAGHVANLMLPSLNRDLTDPSDTGAPYQEAIQTFLKTADAGDACGWVIDLRQHSGGDMWPGMRGLAPLLGPGSHGAFITAQGAKPWAPGTALSKDVLKKPDAPVAVLLGPKTGSSGEMMAIAFAGRPATRSFGQPTAGFTTANGPVVLSDRAVLVLTTAHVADRLGRRYDGPMTPDEPTTPDATEAAAMAWLARQGCAAR
jgi:C-terminal processing protease CtpA/Prc